MVITLFIPGLIWLWDLDDHDKESFIKETL